MKHKNSINRKAFVFTYALLAVLLFPSCGSKQASRFVCNCEQQKQLQSFVKESIKPSNNMSEEEMEDVIRQLRIDGIKVFCKQRPVWVKYGSEIDWKKQKFDTCQSIMDAW